MRAQALGYTDLKDYCRVVHVGDCRRLQDLAEELECHESAVRGHLKRFGLGPDRSRSYGARASSMHREATWRHGGV